VNYILAPHTTYSLQKITMVAGVRYLPGNQKSQAIYWNRNTTCNL